MSLSGREAQHARVAPRRLDDEFRRKLELPQRLLAVLEVPLPGIGGPEPSYRALDERDTQPLLERDDARAYRARRRPETARSAIEAAQLHHRNEDRYLVEPHSRIMHHLCMINPYSSA